MYAVAISIGGVADFRASGRSVSSAALSCVFATFLFVATSVFAAQNCGASTARASVAESFCDSIAFFASVSARSDSGITESGSLHAPSSRNETA